MKHLFSKLNPSQRQNFWLSLSLVAAALVVALIWDFRQSSDDSPAMRPEAESVETAATYIPAGFVLVPIEVANFESLDSILGKFGVVDLFVSTDDTKGRPRKVAERVKILRAPLNPSRFAVLVPESESQKIVAFNGPLTVVVQNPQQSGTSLVIPDPKAPINQRLAKRSRVTVEVLSVD